ncbi:MAG TPA: zinc ABC transporter substrate-binding protein, partial [Aggregatilineales bacterium]|nr:zinc ABC transporter substrate-binding protein [Aggregatilineales bacterium]
FDPRNWELVTMSLAETLAEVDPDNADRYMTNAEAYVEELHTLYEWGVDAMALVPESQRVLVTSHDAFQYFGDAFGWEVRGLQGISTQDEAGVADIQDIAAFVVEREIPVMFVESSVPPGTIEAVQEAVRSRGFDVGIGVRVLFSDAMGEPGTFGGTYIGMIGTNVITILQSFGVEVPQWSAGLTAQPSAELFEMES